MYLEIALSPSDDVNKFKCYKCLEVDWRESRMNQEWSYTYLFTEIFEEV